MEGFNSLFKSRVSEVNCMNMIRELSKQEIKSVIFYIEDDKAPGLDGYSSKFFKAAWSIVGDEELEAIIDFFNNGKLLREVNSMVITLVPKLKCRDLMEVNQLALILDRRISDNILLAQELFKNYHSSTGAARCAFKVDIQEAYDSVDWGFLIQTLKYFGFSEKMIGWIKECVTTPSFSVLSLIIRHKTRERGGFKYHFRCDKLGISHLCFADDLFLFCHEDPFLVQVLRDPFKEFSEVSGLVPNIAKNSSFFFNVKDEHQAVINNIMGFDKGKLPIRYLGVPKVYLMLTIEKLMCSFLWSGNDMSKGKGPLDEIVPSQIFYLSGLGHNARVSDIFRNGLWEWPEILGEEYPVGYGVFLMAGAELSIIQKHTEKYRYARNSVVWGGQT
ncbi:uncharacterized protein LOC116141830 [Pistacia vera]|uniref:uncharacterized protein LOC116141830 n=1 Tax=Pistacia vera TaxID=55513 RepID=UPI0012635954|nr:uncharacterized protein LOC116141830 [Pistacia vera]